MNTISNFLITDIFVPLLNSLWQGASIAALVWIAMRFLPRLNAATRYVIWWIGLAVVLVLPLLPAWHLSGSAPAIVRSSIGSSTNPLLPEIETPAIVRVRPVSAPGWPLAVALLWSVTFLYHLTRVARSFVYLRRVKAGAVTSSELLPPTGRNARLLLSAGVLSPMAVGFRQPAVILPVSLPAELEKSELDHVLLHEASHLARWDDWTNLAARLSESVLALHPIALWILRRIEREREIACDEWVVAHTGQARNYAASLAHLYEMRWPQREVTLAPGMFGHGSRLAERVELLVQRGREFSGRVSAKRVLLGTLALLAFAAAGARAPRWIAFAQPVPRPSFEVASVKPGRPNSRFGVGVQGNLLVANNAPLSILVGFAYDVQRHQILGGPPWIDTDRFTIEARAPIPGPRQPSNRVRLMLQSLLAERFKLGVHRETRTEQVYELGVAKGSSKLKESAGPGVDGRTGIFGTGREGEMAGYDVSLTELVGILSQRLGSPVIDKTGLTGKYDFKLAFMPEPTREDRALFGAGPPDAAPPFDPGLPSVFTAVQEQLGLKLESRRGPVEVLVIDNAEKPQPN